MSLGVGAYGQETLLNCITARCPETVRIGTGGTREGNASETTGGGRRTREGCLFDDQGAQHSGIDWSMVSALMRQKLI